MARTWQFRSRGPRIRNSNKGVVVDGWRFDSQAEAQHYRWLRVLKEQGEILGFDIHPRFRLSPHMTYEADFTVYFPDGGIEVQDVKGFETREFKRKERIFNELHPLAPLVKIPAKAVAKPGAVRAIPARRMP